MGRTLASVTQQVQLEEERLQRFRRALPREDQILFDQLFAFARKRIAATAMAADPLPMQSILMSMLIGVLGICLHLAERMDRAEELLSLSETESAAEEESPRTSPPSSSSSERAGLLPEAGHPKPALREEK
ncbi:MAG: hypothetical protein ABSG98_11470 [Anaerolineales bacterium]|jgi:hypothetical protein